MRFSLRWPTLPLFSKELIEQSNRRRTFVVRTLYAALTYAFLMFVLWERLGGWSSNSLSLMGRGRELFEWLVWMQFFAIYAFLPGLACGVLTAEKERDTLAMLMLTKLGPWTILFEKLLSRLMPMGLLMLLALPLLAVAYSLGGVEPAMILGAVWVLSVTAFQVGALALMCSAWFRTTAGAFVGTYVIGFCTMILPAILAALGVPVFHGVARLLQLASGGQYYGPSGEALLIGFGPYVFEMAVRPNLTMPAINFSALNFDTGMQRNLSILVTNLGAVGLFCLSLVWRTTVLWLSGIVCLVLARIVLWPRAFVQPKQRILQFFRWLDGVFHRLNQNSVTKGIVLINESVSLPLFQPISWRETKKKTLGTTRYLIRYLMAVEPPLLFFLLLADSGANRYGGGNGMTPAVFPNIILWLIMTLSITVFATGLIAGEKAKQTLDVLLATPLTPREIIGQKMAGVRKLVFVMWIPLLTVAVFDLWWRSNVWFSSASMQYGLAWWLVERLLPLVVYPALVAWIGFHFGLRLRNQGQAMLATIGVITAWCIVPAFLHGALSFLRDIGMVLFGRAGWAIFSPVVYIVEPLKRELWQFNDYYPTSWAYRPDPQMYQSQELMAFVIHFGLCLIAWFVLSWWGYRSFAKVVKRNEGTDREPAAAVVVPATA